MPPVGSGGLQACTTWCDTATPWARSSHSAKNATRALAAHPVCMNDRMSRERAMSAQRPEPHAPPPPASAPGLFRWPGVTSLPHSDGDGVGMGARALLVLGGLGGRAEPETGAAPARGNRRRVINGVGGVGWTVVATARCAKARKGYRNCSASGFGGWVSGEWGGGPSAASTAAGVPRSIPGTWRFGTERVWRRWRTVEESLDCTGHPNLFHS